MNFAAQTCRFAGRQVPLRVRYDGVQLDRGYVADIIVRDEVLLELGSVEQLLRSFSRSS